MCHLSGRCLAAWQRYNPTKARATTIDLRYGLRKAKKQMRTFARDALRSRYRITAIVGVVAATVGLVLDRSPWGMNLDTDVGLRVFYHVRGPLPPPSDVMIVNMSRRSADRLDLSSNYSDWPRSLHISLIKRLSERGAAVIVFDVLFKRKRLPDVDAQLGDAIAKSGRTILFQSMGRDAILRRDKKLKIRMVTESIVSPIDEIAYGAAALSPFPLPRVPNRVDQFWTFKSSIGTVPTMPLVALQVWALQSPEFAQKVSQYAGAETHNYISTYLGSKRHHADLARLMIQLRRISLEKPARRTGRNMPIDSAPDSALPEDKKARIWRALFDSYKGPDSHFINYYGPPGTIRTIPYDRVLAAPKLKPDPDFQGKVVFVGVSELTTTDKKEGFHTIFSRGDGVELSGVEIAATALANLLHGNMLKHLDDRSTAAAIFAFGLLVAAIATLLSGIRGAITSIGFGGFYFAVAQYAFTKYNLLLPTMVPLLIQLPAVVLLGLLAQYVFAKRLGDNLERGIQYYVTSPSARRLALGKAPEVSTELVNGVCLITDLQGYTPLSESLSLDALAEVTSQYYDVAGRPVENHGGHIFRYSGDGMLCAWTPKTFKNDSDMRLNACLAALEIEKQIDSYNLENALNQRSIRLSIRIGLHSGEFVMGNVGGGHHYEESVLGDVINTASRIEMLNKYLKTKILVSGPVSAELTTLDFRNVGNFQVAGKSNALPIFELVAAPVQSEFCCEFEEMLKLYRSENWQEAAQKLDQLLSIYPDDGPTMYYRDICDRYLKSPPSRGAGVAVMMKEK